MLCLLCMPDLMRPRHAHLPIHALGAHSCMCGAGLGVKELCMSWYGAGVCTVS